MPRILICVMFLPARAREVQSRNWNRCNGTDVMAKLAEKLQQMKDRGTVREQFVGTFDSATQTAEFLYGIKPDGDLLWYMHRIITRKADAPAPASQTSNDVIAARNSRSKVLTSPPAQTRRPSRAA